MFNNKEKTKQRGFGKVVRLLVKLASIVMELGDGKDTKRFYKWIFEKAEAWEIGQLRIVPLNMTIRPSFYS